MKKKFKYIYIIFIIILLLLIAFFLLLFYRNDSDPQHISNPQHMSNTKNMSAQEIVADINVGWNLGNSLDSCTDASYRNDGSYPASFYETAWGNPVVTKEFIDTVAASGFRAIRIPVTWFYNTYEQDGHLYIREEWLKRVAEVIQYALDNDMYVILNSHHDAPIIWADMNDIDEVSGNAEDLWKQIATYFKDYDHKLLFESYNEINTKDNSWAYSDSASQASNILNQLFVDTVRATGGNNENRVLICNTYLTDTEKEVLDSFVLPTDSVSDRLIIQVHSYCPYYNQDISDLFMQLSLFSEEQNAPVIIGEFGTTTSFVPADYRAQHAGNYVSRAAQYGLKCFWWDNGLEYQLFDRTSCTVTQGDILNALMNPCEFTTNDTATYRFDNINDYTYAILRSEDGSLTHYSNGALTLNPNGIGLSVIPAYGYRLTLHMKNSGTGIRIIGIAFYDNEQNLISHTPVDNQTDYDITAPENASYMRVSLYNPWGYRSIQEYQQYLNQENLSLDITEYQKP